MEISSLHETWVFLDQNRKILKGRIKELETTERESILETCVEA